MGYAWENNYFSRMKHWYLSTKVSSDLFFQHLSTLVRGDYQILESLCWMTRQKTHAYLYLFSHQADHLFCYLLQQLLLEKLKYLFMQTIWFQTLAKQCHYWYWPIFRLLELGWIPADHFVGLWWHVCHSNTSELADLDGQMTSYSAVNVCPNVGGWQ